jgi:hypothetical protein
MDERGGVAFLETDKLDSVRFYARCGFEVSEEGEILGTPNWWMRRPGQKPVAGFVAGTVSAAPRPQPLL